MAGLGSGGAAVFLTHVEAGPVALIAAGFLLLVIGASGQLPNRLKIGDNEAEWGSLARFVRETAETTAEVTATHAVRSELDLAMQRLQQIAPEYTATIPRTAFHFHAIHAIREAADKLGNVQYEAPTMAGSGYPALTGTNGKRAHFAVVGDPNSVKTDKYIRETVAALPSLAETGVDRLLFLAREEFPRSLRATVLNSPLIEAITINYEDAVPQLMATIASLLELPRT